MQLKHGLLVIMKIAEFEKNNDEVTKIETHQFS